MSGKGEAEKRKKCGIRSCMKGNVGQADVRRRAGVKRGADE